MLKTTVLCVLLPERASVFFSVRMPSLRECNVFSRVCKCVCSDGEGSPPVQTCSLGNAPPPDLLATGQFTFDWKAFMYGCKNTKMKNESSGKNLVDFGKKCNSLSVLIFFWADGRYISTSGTTEQPLFVFHGFGLRKKPAFDLFLIQETPTYYLCQFFLKTEIEKKLDQEGSVPMWISRCYLWQLHSKNNSNLQ